MMTIGRDRKPAASSLSRARAGPKAERSGGEAEPSARTARSPGSSYPVLVFLIRTLPVLFTALGVLSSGAHLGNPSFSPGPALETPGHKAI